MLYQHSPLPGKREKNHYGLETRALYIVYLQHAILIENQSSVYSRDVSEKETVGIESWKRNNILP